ncbi:MAG: EF-hand domain-containing protein [Pseudomonadota bacterium]|nr:EF-hand domain-containing protein [Pseudomonadota bacterium]
MAGNSSADEVFKALDNDGDGKVNRQELSDSVRKLADQLDSQFQQRSPDAAHKQRRRAEKRPYRAFRRGLSE